MAPHLARPPRPSTHQDHQPARRAPQPPAAGPTGGASRVSRGPPAIDQSRKATLVCRRPHAGRLAEGSLSMAGSPPEERGPAATSVIMAASSATRPGCLRAGQRQREQRIWEDLVAATGTPGRAGGDRAAPPGRATASGAPRPGSGAGNPPGETRRPGPPAAGGPCRGIPRPGN
jgi:hypothetical protein